MEKLSKKEEKAFLLDESIPYQEKIKYCNSKANYYFEKSNIFLKLAIFFGILALICRCISLIIN